MTLVLHFIARFPDALQNCPSRVYKDHPLARQRISQCIICRRYESFAVESDGLCIGDIDSLIVETVLLSWCWGWIVRFDVPEGTVVVWACNVKLSEIVSMRVSSREFHSRDSFEVDLK